MQIVIYSKNNCVYCDKAKALMKGLGHKFEEKKLETELNGCNRWFCGAGISKRAVPLSGGGTAV